MNTGIGFSDFFNSHKGCFSRYELNATNTFDVYNNYTEETMVFRRNIERRLNMKLIDEK